MKISKLTATTIILLATATLTTTGCKPSEPEVERREITGTIKSKREVSPGNWVVRMEFVNKTGNTIPVEGDVNPDTEVLINGRAAKMDDVREGEHAEVLGEIVTTDQGRTITALKLRIARDESVSFGKAESESKKTP